MNQRSHNLKHFFFNLMPDFNGPRWSAQKKEEADAEDCRTHAITVDSTFAYYFTPGGIRKQDKALHCALEAYERHQVPLCCRECKAGLGSYIYSRSGNQGLSENQQRKNRNIMLFGKSHLKSAHGLLALQSVPLTRVGEPNLTAAQQISQPTPSSALPSCTSGSNPDIRTSGGSIPQAHMIAKQFRARATSATLPSAPLSIKTVIPGTDSNARLAVNPQQRDRNTEIHEQQIPQERPSVAVEYSVLKSEPTAAAHGAKRKSASSDPSTMKRQKICDETNLREVSAQQRQDPAKVESNGLVETCTRSSAKVYENNSQQFRARTQQVVERKTTESHDLDIAFGKQPKRTSTETGKSSPSNACANKTNISTIMMQSSNISSMGVGKKEGRFQQESRQAEKNDAESLAAEGMEYFNAQSYDEALRCCQQAAAIGSLAAQYTLAEMYKEGLGVEQSWTNALEWFLKASEQGYPLAQLALGEMYELGSGVDQSPEKAMEWYHKVVAADTSVPGWNKVHVICARVNLALMHRDGEHVRKYTPKDVMLFHEAVELPDYHDTRVLHELGTIYYTGNGIPRKNIQTGMKWWQKAADKHHFESHYSLGCAHKEMNEMRFSVEHWTKAAEQGHREAAYNLGNWYTEKKPQESSLDHAKKWWLKAAKQGHVKAQYEIALLYETGTPGFEQSTVTAHQWFQRAAEQGHELSRQKLSQQFAVASTTLA